MLVKCTFAALFTVMTAVIFYSMHHTVGDKNGLYRRMRNLSASTLVPVVSTICCFMTVSKTVAEISYSIFFASIDTVLVMFMVYFYLYAEEDTSKPAYRIILAAVICTDQASLLLNNLFHHEFSVSKTTFCGAEYFVVSGKTSVFSIHLAICYVICAICVWILCKKILTSPHIYRKKYVPVLLSLFVVLVVDGMSMVLVLPINYSILAYGAMAILIKYNTLIKKPQQLVNDTVAVAVEKMETGIACFDIDGEPTYSNEAFWKILGKERNPEELKRLYSTWSEYNGLSGKNAHVWNDSWDVDGDTVYVSAEYRKMYDKYKEYIGSYFNLTNITKRVKESEKKIAEAQKENKAKSEFLSRMSHEIRTPLNSVYGMNEMILRESGDPQILSYAEDIKASSEMVLSIINEILDYSKFEAGKMSLVERSYSLRKIIPEVIEMMDNLAKQKELALSYEIEDQTPDALYGDADKLKQILVNLLSNAIKYTKEGSVRLNITCKRKEEAEGKDRYHLYFAVSDTGIGIKEEDIPKLFDAYNRVEEVKNHSIQGTGLGLNIVQKALALMDSSLIVNSKYGEGSVFSFEIWQQQGQLNIEQEEKGTGREVLDLSEKSILLVDDSPLNRKVIKAFVKDTGAIVDEADGGLPALDLIGKNKYDIIFLDHMMPDLSGVEVFEKLKTVEHPNKETPFIMLTANVIGDMEKEYSDMGFNGFVAKPVKPDLLNNILRKYLT